MKNNKGFSVVLMVIAVLAIVGIAYYAGTKNSENITPVSSEEASNEIFNNQPGAVKSIKAEGNNQWTLAVDLLTRNPKWLPGVDSNGGFFINQNPKIRNLTVTKDTKTYNCENPGPMPKAMPNSLQNAFISEIQDTINRSKTEKGLIGEFGYTAYFDINGNTITAIYQQCLP